MIWIALALLITGLAFVLLMLIGSKDDESETGKLTQADKEQDALPSLIRDFLAGNGVELPAAVVYLSLAMAGGATLLSLLVLPLNMALMALLLIPALLYLTVKVLGAKRRRMMQEQLPSFINQVTRRLSAGISVENAFSDSVETLEAPLGTVMRRVMRRVHMGDELHRAFDREANQSHLHEFNVLATAIRINEQYGGSIRSILDDIVSILRLDESGKRELAAMTGETRFTAMVLAVIPPLTGAYMFWASPDMVLNMWHDATGHMLVIAATMMEITGIVVLWRMVKSIGA